MQNLGGQTKSIMVFSEVAYLKRSFGYSGALLWNSLPEGIIGRLDQLGSLRRKSIAHFKPSIPTRQSCKSVFL